MPGTQSPAMGPFRNFQAPSARSGFSLIEFAAIAAILGILAAAVGINAMERMRRAAREAESLSMETMAAALKTNILRHKRIPASSEWPQAIATELSIPVARVLATRTGNPRAFLEDPGFSIGAPTGAVRNLPYQQSSAGSIEPVNPRAILVSSVSENA